MCRNILATWIVCGFWDWFLYFGPLKDKLHKYKVKKFFITVNKLSIFLPYFKVLIFSSKYCIKLILKPFT